MKIETYEIEECARVDADVMAADSEAIELINKLGLAGQQSLTSPETGTRFPYPRVSKTQSIVIGALFPESATVEDYRQGIIPLRVLQVIAFCRDMPQTKWLTIHHAASIKEDPILTGRTGQYTGDEYLLARWGDALPSFDELKIKAAPLLKSRIALEIQTGIRKLQGYAQSIDELVSIYIESGDKPTWSIYD